MINMHGGDKYNHIISWNVSSRRGALVVITALRRRLPGSVGRLVVGERGGREQWVPAVRALWERELVEADLGTSQGEVVLEPAAALPQHHHEGAAQRLTRLNIYIYVIFIIYKISAKNTTN